jgi:hypothetical protein
MEIFLISAIAVEVLWSAVTHEDFIVLVQQKGRNEFYDSFILSDLFLDLRTMEQL